MDHAALARLSRWTQSLFDKADRLLDLADHGIAIPGDPVRLVFSLVGGSKLPLAEATDPALVALLRTGRDALADGEHVLWLTIGTLTYLDREAHEHTAPLLLWPVALERDGAIIKLAAAPERAPRLNDALIAKYELSLFSTAELDLSRVLAAADELCVANPGWSVARVARLTTFSFAELDMWKDLAAKDLTGPDASVPIQWLLGELAPPHLALGWPPLNTDYVLPLDADGSQVAAVAAAAAGASFVLQGPPGTGKSQTIANLLVQCASQGTSVLVVSDRVAALEAIQQRLASVGLGEVCSIAGQAIERVSRPHVNAPAGAGVVRTRLAEVATALDGHVRALHGADRLGFTVHEAMARLIELKTTPRAALAEADAASLDRITFDRRKRAVTELGDAALAIEPVAQHPWRASALATWTADGTLRATQALETAGDAAAALAAAVELISTLVPGLVMRTPEQLRAVGLLAQLAASSPRPGAELLTGPRGRAGNLDEEVGLIRARGGGTLETPRDPISFITIAQRHRALVIEVGEHFIDPASLDAPELWTQLKKWTTSMAPLRYIALRTARAGVKAAALPGGLATDAEMLSALEAVIAERACRAALVAAAEPAARWFGALGGDPLAVDLGKLDAALAWTAELRKAFDQVTVQFGEPGRLTAWRALVAQVAAIGADECHDLLPFAKLADAVARWEPAVAELEIATGISSTILAAGTDHLIALRAQIAQLATSVGTLAHWTRFHLARRAAVDAGIRSPITAIERGDLEARELALAWERATLLAWADAAVKRAPELAHFDGAKHHQLVTSFADLDRGAMAVMRGRLPKLAPCVLATPQSVARCALPMFDLVVFDEASRLPVAHA
ncbi:MAG TPA: AAA domain-containing protein, partial [Kofleriaceae bacterium]